MRAVAIFPKTSVSTSLTILQVKAVRALRLTKWGIYCFGINNIGIPIHVELWRQTTAGTMTSLTPVDVDGTNSEAIVCTAQHTATAEPTKDSPGLLREIAVHEQGGYEEPVVDPSKFVVKKDDYIGIFIATAPAYAVEMCAMIEWDE